MKKKLLVFCVLAMAIMCLFAISVSAASTEAIDGVTYYLNNGSASVTNANKSCTLETVIIPETVTGADGTEYTVKEINTQAFQSNTSIKYVSIPATVTKVGQQAFQSCTNLVFVDFNDNANAMSWPGCGVFDNCKSLKAISLPDGLAKIPDQCFRNCAELTAVYLPSSLQWISGNKGDDGAGFYNNAKMYFVQDSFDVVDKNGNFYTADTFEAPAKPAIYYFPSGLLYLCGHHNRNSSHSMDANGMVANTGLDDLAITNCKNLNSILVLPEGFTGFDDVANKGNADQRGDTVGSGLIRNCATKENPITVVFMGKIDRVSMDRKSGGTQYMTYVFANEANTDFENTKIGTWYNTSDSGYQNQNEMYVVFCHANNGEGAKYKVSFVGQEGNTVYPVLTSELQDGATIHMVSPANNVLVAEPDCVTDRLTNTFCFCGKAIDVNKAEEGTALGHEFDLEKGATKFNIVYANYLANGTLNIKCARCEECNGSDVDPIISSFKGFSTKEEGSGLTFGYTLDLEAIKEYEAVNGKTLEFGFVVAVQAFLGDNAPLDKDGNAASDKVIKASITSENYTYTGADFRLTGNWDGTANVNGEEVAVKDIKFYMAGYILDGTSVIYINDGATSDKADAVSYNQFAVVEEAPVE
ncbi:MAG: leucine-rich repeat domain-containing protein [Clostridia bacterium]|nr:leucine-rich repeat domain-containing protein [Clostridia bacterium]